MVGEMAIATNEEPLVTIKAFYYKYKTKKENETLEANEFLELFESYFVICEIKSFNIYHLLDYLKEQREMGNRNFTDKIENIRVKNGIGVSESLTNYIERQILNGSLKIDEDGMYTTKIAIERARINLLNNKDFSYEMNKIFIRFQAFENLNKSTSYNKKKRY